MLELALIKMREYFLFFRLDNQKIFCPLISSMLILGTCSVVQIPENCNEVTTIIKELNVC